MLYKGVFRFFCVLLRARINNKNKIGKDMRKKHALMASLLFAGSVVALTSCSDGKTNSLQAQIDSLNNIVEHQAQELDYSQSCLSLITESIDSLAMADSTLIRVTTNREGTLTKESIREDLNGYKNILQHQRARLNELEQQVRANGTEMAKMASVISYLSKQLAAKDAQIQDLQNMLEQSNFDIAQLQNKVTQLYNSNSDLQSTISSQQEVISAAQEMMNEAFYIIGTSKELKAAGVLSGKFLGKSKVNANNINSELFNKVDIRQVTSIRVDSEKPTIKSQHPSNSYRIVPNKKDKTSEIQIIDEIDFWSLTHYLIIQK